MEQTLQTLIFRMIASVVAMEIITPKRPNLSRNIAARCLAPERKPAGFRHGVDEDEWNDPPLLGGAPPLLNRAPQRALLFEPVLVIPPAPTKRARTESLTPSASKRPNAYRFDGHPSAFMRCAASLEDAAEEAEEDEEDEEDD
jgi:hypothetical protein